MPDIAIFAISSSWVKEIRDSSVLSSFRAGKPRTSRSLLKSQKHLRCWLIESKPAGRTSAGQPPRLAQR